MARYDCPCGTRYELSVTEECPRCGRAWFEDYDDLDGGAAPLIADGGTVIDWPQGFERTPFDARSQSSGFRVTLARALDDLEGELEAMGVDDFRISTAAPQRQRDNRPYKNANPEDPAFVVRWSMDGEQFAVACDHYQDLRDNVRSVGLYIKEKRKMNDRPIETGESEFANARLPSADDDAIAGGGFVPHEVLDVAPDADEAIVQGAARALLKRHHPDNGGDPETFKEVQKAREAMLDE
jgi:hypothetical protein